MKYFSKKVIGILAIVFVLLIGILSYSYHEEFNFKKIHLIETINRIGFNIQLIFNEEITNRNENYLNQNDEALNILKNVFKIPDTYQPSSITEYFSIEQLDSLMKEQFSKEKMENLKIAYAIGKVSDGEILAASKNYLDFDKFLSKDSANTISFYFPISSNINKHYSEGFLYETLHIIVIDYNKYIFWAMLKILISYVLTIAFLILAFSLILKNLYIEKKLNSSKDDFINYLSHEFKTPLASLKIICANLNITNITKNPNKLEIYSKTINEEVDKLNDNISDLLNISNIKNLTKEFDKISIHIIDLIDNVIQSYNLQIEQKRVQLTVVHESRNYKIKGELKYLYKMFSNLVDNAIKYSSENPIIKVSTYSIQNKFFFQIEDNGIGMDKFTLKHIYNKFYRAHTGNIHNVKGFGIGMTFVKYIADFHHGKIKIESTLGKGSKIILQFKLQN